METKELTEELKEKVVELNEAAHAAGVNLFVMMAGDVKGDNTKTETVVAANGNTNEIIAGLMQAIEDDDNYLRIIVTAAKLTLEERKRKMTQNK